MLYLKSVIVHQLALLQCKSQQAKHKTCIGGFATADWLEDNLETYIQSSWKGGNAAAMAISEAFVEVFYKNRKHHYTAINSSGKLMVLGKSLQEKVAIQSEMGRDRSAVQSRLLTTEIYFSVQADKKLLAPKGGFFGQFSERGIGGSKCGSTGVVALLYTKDKRRKLLTANVGDSRALLIKGGEAEQLTTDHVPDL